MRSRWHRARGFRARLAGLFGLTVALGLILTMLLAPAAQAAGFSDTASSPYHLQIEVLNLLGIVQGLPDGRFHPNSPVSREQFAKMVDLAMRIPVSTSELSTFVDVAKTSGANLYPDHYIAAAAKAGIITGYKGTGGKLYFRPLNSITLTQMVTMGTRAAGRGLFVPPVATSPPGGISIPSKP